MNEDKTPKYKQAPIDLNLPTLPFYRINKRPSNKPETYENEDKSVGIGFFKGMPSTNAQKILTYLLSKSPRKEEGEFDIENIRKHGIRFTYSELCRFLGINNETRNRRTIKEDLIKLGYITIHIHKKYIVKKGSREANYINIKSRGLFEVNLYDDEKDIEDETKPRLPLWHNQIKFDDVILENLKNGIFRFIDVSEIQKINSPVALRIHSILSLHNQSKSWKIGLVKLAKQIPIQTRILRNTKAEIKKGCEVLIETKSISDFSIYKNSEEEEVIEFTFKASNYEEAKNLFLSGRN